MRDERDGKMEKVSQINEQVARVSMRADELYRFVMRYYDFAMERRDYGTGDKLSMVEAHTLLVIAGERGITVSEIAARAKRTRSSISQIVKKLECMGYVHRVLSEEDRRVAYLMPTEKGLELNRAHLLYDYSETMETMNELERYCDAEEIKSFFHVLNMYLKIMDD